MPAAWRAPKRPDHKISQSYNDGFVKIYSIEDAARPGYQPVEKLTLTAELAYEERSVGIKRYYAAKQAQETVKRVLRVQHIQTPPGPRNKAVTEDGREYRIDLVQKVPDVWPPSDDLTLVAYRQGAGA